MLLKAIHIDVLDVWRVAQIHSTCGDYITFLWVFYRMTNRLNISTNYIWKQNDNKMMRATHITKKERRQRHTQMRAVWVCQLYHLHRYTASASLFNRGTSTSKICWMGYNSLSRLIILVHFAFGCGIGDGDGVACRTLCSNTVTNGK